VSVAAVIGGGFYGASIALYLKRSRNVSRVVLLERDARLLTRSSFTNQARLHRGYHYPRSFTTAHRSILNAARFEADFGPAVVSTFTKLYAMARRNSKVTTKQMLRFCEEIGAPLAPAPRDLQALFSPALVGAVFLATEHAFDADILRTIVVEQLGAARIEVHTRHEVVELSQSDNGVRIVFQADGKAGEITASVAFNCTYSRLQAVLGECALTEPFGLKHEISELVLVEPPSELAGIGLTLMDGPFFSIMPFPARQLHSLSHVRYTPHSHWVEDGIDPYQRLADYHRESRADRMIRDAARYVPVIARVRPRCSLFEVKTVLTRNEGDDGRPILLKRHPPHGRIFSVLGGKIDNIYDILERLDGELLPVEERVSEWTH
jgi:glycine/D-amino acid oxidase-like deaminating enzyme